MVERHIPKSKLEKEPHRILSTNEYFNPYTGIFLYHNHESHHKELYQFIL